MPEPAQSAPPSFYNTMSQQTGAGAANPGGAPPPAGDDADVLAAMSKVAGALKKVGKMKDGAQPYIDRMMTAMKEMIVDVFKADPKSLDGGAGAAAPPTDNATPPPDPGNATPPPPAAGAPA